MYLILLSTATTPIFVNLSSVTNSLSNVFFQATGRVDMERALEVLGMEMISHFLKDTVNSKVPNIHQILKEQSITIKIEMISTSNRTHLASQKWTTIFETIG